MINCITFVVILLYRLGVKKYEILLINLFVVSERAHNGEQCLFSYFLIFDRFAAILMAWSMLTAGGKGLTY